MNNIISAIIQRESRGNPSAEGSSGEIGLMQIMPSVLEEYNQRHNSFYVSQDLYDPDINIQIGSWYFLDRIPEMIRYYGKDDNLRNRVIAYNAGISYVVEDVPFADLPPVTQEYVLYMEKFAGVPAGGFSVAVPLLVGYVLWSMVS